ncbi:hypothetical protein C8R45DRAFT_443143 [Mycena sanguinolenta]|nr:hypothetical protein C8R45DRAFT_443143 [Mycena sanguinolenta]
MTTICFKRLLYRQRPTFLPIKAWYLGRKFFDEPYHVLWDPAGTMIIQSSDGPDSVEVKHTEEIDLTYIAKQVSFVPPNESADKLLSITTFEKSRKNQSKALGTQFSEHFQQGGTHGKGDIVLLFDNASPVWADIAYAEFVEWLQGHVDRREKLIGKAAKSKWELAGRFADMFVTRARREPVLSAGVVHSESNSGNSSLKRPNTENDPSRKRQKTMQDKGVQVGSSIEQPQTRQDKGVQVGSRIEQPVWPMGLILLDNTAALNLLLDSISRASKT